MSSLYRIPVALLLRDVPSTVECSFDAPFDERHEFEPRGAAETDIRADADVAVRLTLQSFVGGLRAKGGISAPWFGTCRRCSVLVEGIASVAVDERYVDTIEEGDEEAYLIENDFIDLEPMIHDVLLLDLPLAPLCKEDCLGLCLYCGADRNETPCTCQVPTDARWATLDGLKFAGDEPDDADES